MMDKLQNQVEARLAALGPMRPITMGGGCWPPDAVSSSPFPSWTVTHTPVATVHYFTGAPKNEAKDLPCGVALTTKRIIGGGFMLAGVQACTDVNEVTCLACLRSLIPVIAKGK